MRCPVCSAESEVLPDQLCWCQACDHIFQDPPIVTAVYDKQYVMDRYDKYSTTGLMSHARAAFLKAHIQKGTLLDVGYGNGAFIHTAAAAGFDAYGSDVHGADYGVREVGLDEDRYWDIVTFFDSMEHFPNLDVIRRLSRRSNYTVVSMPCRPDSFPQDRNWKHYRPGEHLHYFSVKSLSRLLSDKKLVVVSNVEDMIRGHGSDPKQWNVFTALFVRSPL